MEESCPIVFPTERSPIDDAEAEAQFARPEESKPLAGARYCWRTVRTHILLIGAAVLMAVGAAALHLMTETPIYTAETTILIQPNAPQGSGTLENLVQIGAAVANSHEYYKTQCAILQSRKLAIDVIRALGLQQNPAFTGKPRARNTGSSQSPAHSPARSIGAPQVPPALVHAYLGMLTVTPIPETSLARISFATPDPRLSAQLADAHVLAYARDQVEMRGQQTEEAQRFLQDKLVEIKQRLEKAQIALSNYRRQEGIAAGQISLDGEDTQALDQLSSLSKALTRARAARVGLEAQAELIRKHEYTSLPAVTNNPAIQDLDRELTGLYSEDAALATQFKSDYPPLVQLQAKIRETQARFAAEVSKVVDGIESAYEQAVDKENQLQAKMDKQRADTIDPDDTATQYAILQRDVDTNGELYNAVLAQLKDVAVPTGAGHANVSVINPAEVPAVPTSPNKLRELILALVAGLSGGIGLAFLFGFIDNALKNPEEAENYLRVPSLGVVPDFSSLNGDHLPHAPSHLADDRSPVAAPQHEGELATLHRLYPLLGQAYGNLRTALLLSRAGAPPQVTLITSAAKGEGKTVTAVNTAVTLAQLGARTLLIDADLRGAGCHRVLAVDNYLGLTEVLTGSRELHDEVIQLTEVENLHILTSGSVPPNPAELLGSKKMAETLIHLREHYEYIVIDSSPVLPASGSLRLAKLADGVVVVANGVTTPRQQVRSACARLGYARAKILGVVLNKMKIRGSGYHPPEDYYSPENHHAAAQQESV